MAKTDLTAERLRELLDYNPETGVFTWLVDRPYNKTKGCVAGTVTYQGYRAIRISPFTYRANRLAWLYMNGSWPVGLVDHRNGMRDDNKFANLRDVTPAENTQNIRTAKSTSTSGLLGAFKSRDGWRSRIMTGGVRVSLGTFSSPELAHGAYLLAKQTYHPVSNPKSTH